MKTCEPGGEDEKNSSQKWNKAEQLPRVIIKKIPFCQKMIVDLVQARDVENAEDRNN